VVRAQAQAEELRVRLMAKERAGVVGELALGVAHDLGNLVGALKAHLSALEHDLGRAGATSVQLTTMGAIVQAQAAMVSKLKSLGRPRPEAPAAVDLLPEVIQPAIQMVQSALRMRDRRHPISIRLDESVTQLAPVVGLRDELVNVLINLFLNGRDASPQGGTIRVSGQAHEGAVVLRVEDQGTGIRDADLPRIFEPFFSTKGGAGMGLGLTIAVDVMGRLGGQITAGNRPEGGAWFELRFLMATEVPALIGSSLDCA
jgi:C4-dicarboxylate-specific signal transduction histidine kinase